MEFQEVREAAERLTGRKVGGVIRWLPDQPDHYQIHLDRQTSSQLWMDALSDEAFLLCIRQPDGWCVNLLDGESKKAYWSEIPDPTSALAAQVVPLMLRGRVEPGAVRTSRLMYDRVHNYRQTFFETDAGPMILHSRRTHAREKRTRYVLEVCANKLYFEWLAEGDLGFLLPTDVRELPALPSFFARARRGMVPRGEARDAGRYFAHSGVAVYHAPLKDVRACLERYHGTRQNEAEKRLSWVPKPGEQPDPGCLKSIMGWAHERNHFVQSMSTPCGLLLWRTLQAITSTAGYLLMKIAESSSVAQTAYLPLTSWYEEGGSEQILNNLTMGSSSKLAAKRRGLSRRQYAKELKVAMERYHQELTTLMRFNSAMLGHREGLSMASFVELANEGFRVLALNSDLSDYPTWKAREPELKSYLPPGGIPLDSILEGDSRVLEHQVLRLMGTTESQWATWREVEIAGKYAPAYEWLMAELGSAEIARVAIAIALTTPIDLICKETVEDGILYVEDCLPSWRLKKVVDAIKQSGWPHERDQAEQSARHDIAARAGIPTPQQTLAAVRGKKFTGEHAWGADHRLMGIPPEATTMECFDYCQREIARGMEIRNNDFLAFTHSEKPTSFQPALEFYADVALFSGAPGSNYSLPFYFKTFLFLIRNKVLLELFYGDGDLSELQQIESAFLSRLEQEGITPQKVGWPGLQFFLHGTLGKDFSNLLHWSNPTPAT